MAERPISEVLKQALSEPRWNKYAAAAQRDGVCPVDFYKWHFQLSEAFYFPLHYAEICCRNAFHLALLYHGDKWYDCKNFKGLLPPNSLANLENVLSKERKKQGDKLTAHHVVSSLTWGFWKSLATNKLQRYLFPKGINPYFPGAPSGKKQADLHELIDKITTLRNKIAHHDAIFDREPQARYDAMLELIKWCAPELLEFVKKNSRVSQIINKRPKRQ